MLKILEVCLKLMVANSSPEIDQNVSRKITRLTYEISDTSIRRTQGDNSEAKTRDSNHMGYKRVSISGRANATQAFRRSRLHASWHQPYCTDIKPERRLTTTLLGASAYKEDLPRRHCIGFCACKRKGSSHCQHHWQILMLSKQQQQRYRCYQSSSNNGEDKGKTHCCL
ncbi:hypothetical protein EDB19DRAFT_1191357 [Suillus lakei]|nr:hypothetical protein EDB19DRAFT_1191357 [Suillus lakei]